MRKGGNNYEDELYEDDYYDDDYYNDEDDYYEEEEIEYKTKNKTKNKTPANIKAQKVTTTTNKQPPQPKPEINQPPKKTTTESKESKTKTDLNSIKYPKISYKINNKKNERNDINIVIIGHVDSGKSTLMGHLLYLLGEIDKKSLQDTSKSFK